jgi:deazaflavin-dependent oxidoreductase (nitroreductase family)
VSTGDRGRYSKPGVLVRNAFNPMVSGLIRLGISVKGSRILEVKGRNTGLARRTPVNLLRYGGQEYLVAPRGNTQWVRNVRAGDGRVTLVLGRRRRERLATEVPDGEKLEVLRAYLRNWKLEAGAFFEGLGADSPKSELSRIAPHHPIFRLSDWEGAD